MKTTLRMFCMVFCAILLMGNLTSCSKDSKDEPSGSTGSIVGTWTKSVSNEYYYVDYTLVFNGDYTGYIRNQYGSRASEEMQFDWSLTTTSDGRYRLSVIYKSGDRNLYGPFEGEYAQWNYYVTLAGNTLSIDDGDGVWLFNRK